MSRPGVTRRQAVAMGLSGTFAVAAAAAGPPPAAESDADGSAPGQRPGSEARGAAPLRIGTSRGYVRSRWGQLHFYEQGPAGAAAPAVILLHQTPWTAVQYAGALPLLAAAGFRAIAVDTPGYGLSDGPAGETTIEAYADDLLALFDRLGLGQAALIGHHTGALIAAGLGARCPQRVTRLVLHGAPLYTLAERSERLAAPHFDQTPQADGGHFVARWDALQRALGPAADPQAMHLAILTFFANGPLEWIGHHAAFHFDLHDALRRITAPTLLLSNTGDRAHPLAVRSRQLRPDFAYAEIEGYSAHVMLTHPAVWAEPIISFLRG